MNLTKRQLICFGAAGAVGIPFYIFTKDIIGTQASALIMVLSCCRFSFWQCMKRTLSGRKDSVLYDKTEIPHTGNTPL